MRAFPLLLAALTLTACADQDAPAPTGEIVDATAENGDVLTPDRVSTADGDVLSAPAAPFNVNTATAEQLATIPGVGERMTHEFEEYRPYASIQQFRREIGKYVDEAQVAAYEEFLFVPIDPNASDAETIMQLADTDAAAADALIAERPFADETAFLARWSELTGGDSRVASVLVESAP